MKKTFKIAILASTNGTDLQAIIDELEAGKMQGIELAGVLSNKSKCYAIERAKKQGYKTFTFQSKNPDGTKKSREAFDQEMLKVLKELEVDLVVLVGYMRILSEAFVDAFESRIINVHPSLLPAFAGGMDTNVHEEVIKSGVKETGCTFHLVTKELDAGPILLQKTCTVDPNETPESLKQKVQALEKEWYPEVIRQLAQKKQNP